MGVRDEAWAETPGRTAPSADLGGKADIQTRNLKTEVGNGSM